VCILGLFLGYFGPYLGSRWAIYSSRIVKFRLNRC